MTLSELSVRRPVLAWTAALLIAAAGLASLGRLPVREYPDVEPPRVSVRIAYPGASAELVERDVTRVVEDNLNGIEDVALIDSRSREGFAQITVEFALGRDLDAAAADVRDRVSAVRAELPEEAEAPAFRKASAEAQAMMWITLTSERRDRRALTDIAVRRLLDPLAIQPGVSQVILGGARRYAMRVRLDAARLSAFGVTTTEVAAALRRENLEAPAGRLESGAREYAIRTETVLPDAGGFAALILRDGPEGAVRLGDVAEVELGAESDRSAVFRDGAPAIGLGVVRQSNANALSVAEAVREELESLREGLPGDIEMAVSYDETAFIDGSIREVLRTLALTVGLVIAVVYLTLGEARAAIPPAVTIPGAVLGAVGAMLLLGFSINTLTLLALVLAIGLVVDDAIVVVESATRMREQGARPLAAAALGASRVFAPVIATTAALVAVLIPIAALGGLVGRLFTEFALTLSAAIAVSSFLALTLGATLSARIRGGEPDAPSRRVSGALARAERGYARLVGRLVGVPWLAILLTAALAALGWRLVGAIPGGLAPTEDRGVFIVAAQGPPGAALSETEDAVRRIERVLAPHRGPGEPIEEIISILGAGDAGPPQVNSAIVIAKLRPWSERETAQQALVAEVAPAILSIPSVTAVPINPASLTPESFGKPVQMALSAPDYDAAYDWARRMRGVAAGFGTLRGIEVEFDRASPQIALTVDRRLAADLGLSVAGIGETLRLFMGGSDVSEFYRDGETYEVMLRGRPEDRDEPEDIGVIEARAQAGALTPLATVVDAERRGAAAEFRRIDRRPSVVLSAAPREGSDLAATLRRLETEAGGSRPPGGEVSWLGLSRDFTQSQAGVATAFGLALAVVYLTLAALFSSFVLPLAALFVAPLAATAGLAALWATGYGLTVFAQIGILLAIGLLAKNAILVIDFAEGARAEGADAAEAARRGGAARFRPVVMTSVATLMGALPLALATGPGAEGRAVIGIVAIAGVLGATFVTLFLTPALYRLAAARIPRRGAASRALDAALEADAPSG